jgi:hypothetical protein
MTGPSGLQLAEKSLVGATCEASFLLLSMKHGYSGTRAPILYFGEGFDQRIGVGDSLLCNHVRCPPLTTGDECLHRHCGKQLPIPHFNC